MILNSGQMDFQFYLTYYVVSIAWVVTACHTFIEVKRKMSDCFWQQIIYPFFVMCLCFSLDIVEAFSAFDSFMA